MADHLLAFQIPELPDPADPANQRKADVNVQAAVLADSEGLLRSLAGFSPASVSVMKRLVYSPPAPDKPPQDRLGVYLLGRAHHEAAAARLRLLLAQGSLSRFYTLQAVAPPPVDWDQFHAACDVVRKQSILDATVSIDGDPHALPAYYIVDPFAPRRDRDDLALDRVLSGLDEPVLIEVCVEPADITSAASAHARYLGRLQRTRHIWRAQEDDLLTLAWGDRGGGSRLSLGGTIDPPQPEEALIDEVRRRQRRFGETLVEPHLRFHIRMLSQSPDTARLVASVVAETAFEDGAYQLLDSARGDGVFEQIIDRGMDVRVAPVPALDRVAGDRFAGLYGPLGDLAHLATVDELASVCRPPLVSYGSPLCIRKSTDPPCESPEDLIVLGWEQQAGSPDGIAGARPVPRGIRLGNLCKHLFISGMPGSGKTTAVLNLLMQLDARDIPFMVIEPVKTEYRLLKMLKRHPDAALRRLAKRLQVYTPGAEAISPMRLNPLRVIEGISRDSHIEALVHCYRGAAPMGGPLPEIIAQGLEVAYEEHSDADDPPRMVDLHAAARDVLNSKGYSGDVDSDIRAALGVRSDSLTRRTMGRVFQCGQDAPMMEKLMSGPTLVEVAALAQDHACLLTLFLLTAVREYVRVTPNRGGQVRFVMLIEEAHQLVGRNTDASPSEENADPKAFAAQMVAQSLAELRALGVAIVIVDQFPSRVAPEVSKATATKCAFRQVEAEDREAVGNSMGFGPIETQEIARLMPGEAYFYTEGYFGPRLIRCPNLQADFDLPDPPAGDAIAPYLQDDPWFAEAATVRIQAELDELERQMNAFDSTRLRFIKQAAKLAAAFPRALAQRVQSDRAVQISDLAERGRSLHVRLERAFKTFQRDAYRPLLGHEPPDVVGEELQQQRRDLIHRFEHIIEPDTQACLSLLARLSRGQARGADTTEGA